VIVAVTGALGNVGSAVVAGLAEAGHQVVALDRRRTDEAAFRAAELASALAESTGLERESITPGAGADTIRSVDLTSYEETRSALEGADAVVHLAGIPAPVGVPDWEVHNNNVVASYNVLSAAAELGIARVVQSSSVNAIGLAWSRNPTFDYFPIDLEHGTRNEDGYSLSKLAQELQADSLTRRHEGLSVVSLRLHAVLERAGDAQAYIDRFGNGWAVHGLFGYCTFASTTGAVIRSVTAPIEGHERLWVVEPRTFLSTPSRELARRFYPGVPIGRDLEGTSSFFDASRTRDVLGWTPSTISDPPTTLACLSEE